MPKPVVSVVLCVRNGEKYIREALDSVAAQRVDGLEVIVVDDGSSDGTVEIAQNHPLLPRVDRQGLLGLPAALNCGLGQARGQFIAYIDADDVWPADRLSRMIEVFDRNREAEIVYGQIVNTDAILRPLRPPILSRILTALLVRRDSALKVGEFRTDVAHAANVDWISRAGALRLKLSALDEVVLFRRIHGENMGLRDQRRGRQDLLSVIRDHHARTKS